jgi:uracil-DNA glycosylase family 4
MDRLKSALHAALPMLREMQDGFARKPSVQTDSLRRLRGLAIRPLPDPEPPKAAGGATSPALIPGREWTMESLREAALRCVECPHLVRSRKQVVFGVGNPDADLMFVGEAPGADEDDQGEPFVGRAGQLLTKIVQTMGFSRDDIYIGNVLKCRPDMPAGSTGNRKPKPEEMRTCLPWLEKQIEFVRPKALVALGATAVEGLLGDTRPMNQLRGRWLDYKGIPVMPTYHPAYLLRNQSLSEKRKVWEDMLLVLEKLGVPISEKQRGFFLSK